MRWKEPATQLSQSLLSIIHQLICQKDTHVIWKNKIYINSLTLKGSVTLFTTTNQKDLVL